MTDGGTDQPTDAADQSAGLDVDDSRSLMHRVYVEEPAGVAATVGDVPVCPTCLRAFDPGRYGPVVCEDCWQEDLAAKGQGGKRYVTEHGQKKHYTPACPHVRGSKYWMTSDESCVYGRRGPCGTCGPGRRGRRVITDGGVDPDDPQHPIQTTVPSRIHDDREQTEAALTELKYFIGRADVPPGHSTLDPNLRRARDHLEDVCEGVNRRDGAYENIDSRGIYLVGDTPLTAHPLALEDGRGDKNLLFESLREQLSTGALIELKLEAEEEIEERYEAEGSDSKVDIDDFYPIDCVLCGHSSETPEEHEQHMQGEHDL